MIKAIIRTGFLFAVLFGASIIYGDSVEDRKPSWVKPNKQIIFLDETEIIGQKPRPTSRFHADHIAKTIRPFTIHKDARAILEHYEPQSGLKAKFAPFYDGRRDRRNW